MIWKYSSTQPNIIHFCLNKMYVCCWTGNNTCIKKKRKGKFLQLNSESYSHIEFKVLNKEEKQLCFSKWLIQVYIVMHSWWKSEDVRHWFFAVFEIYMVASALYSTYRYKFFTVSHSWCKRTCSDLHVITPCWNRVKWYWFFRKTCFYTCHDQTNFLLYFSVRYLSAIPLISL